MAAAAVLPSPMPTPGGDTNYTITLINEVKGRGMVASKNFTEGETILVEEPIISAQFQWNKDCKYKACDHCLRPLESVTENVRRLTAKPDYVLPFAELHPVDFKHIPCAKCGVLYCSEDCQKSAWDRYHKILCFGKPVNEVPSSHPLMKLIELWKQCHYPPETGSIVLLCRLVAYVRSSPHPAVAMEKFRTMCSDFVGDASTGVVHKLIRGDFEEQLGILYSAFATAFTGDDLEELFTVEGFVRLMTLMGRNAQGIATSPMAEWVKKLEEHKLDLPTAEQTAEVDRYIQKLYEDVEDGVGLQFLDNEGSGLYETQSCINHSCDPNCEVKFPFSTHKLAIVTTRDIKAGEEICISYLDECELQRGRKRRQKLLKENYVFECRCPRCITEESRPEEEDDEDDEDWEDAEEDDEEMES